MQPASSSRRNNSGTAVISLLFKGGAQLAEHEPVAHCPGADQMHGALPRTAAAAQGLAVHGDDLAGQ